MSEPDCLHGSMDGLLGNLWWCWGCKRVVLTTPKGDGIYLSRLASYEDITSALDIFTDNPETAR